MSWWRISFVVAAMSLAGMLSSPAGAAPASLGELKVATASGASTTKVHWRRYRHCHWHHGRRYCHGRRYYRHGYGPGIHLYIGRRHDHHYRHHHHRWH